MTWVRTSFLRDIDWPIDSRTCKQKNEGKLWRAAASCQWKGSPCKQGPWLTLMIRNFRNNPVIPNFLWLKSQTNLIVNNISDLHDRSRLSGKWLQKIHYEVSDARTTKIASIVDQCKFIHAFKFLIISWLCMIYSKRMHPLALQLLPWSAEKSLRIPVRIFN